MKFLKGKAASSARNGAQPSPYTLDQLASYYRNYVIFGAVFALGLNMISREFGDNRTLPGLDYATLPGVPHDFIIPVAGAVFVGAGLLLCIWNAFETIMALRRFADAGSVPLFKRAIVVCALLVGALVPYGLAMLALSVLLDSL